jgi:hypothetical protein
MRSSFGILRSAELQFLTTVAGQAIGRSPLQGLSSPVGQECYPETQMKAQVPCDVTFIHKQL